MAEIPRRPLRLLLLLLLPALVVANPSKIGCNLVTDSNRDVMTSTTNMMGSPPSTNAAIITSQSATTFTAGSAGASAHQPCILLLQSRLSTSNFLAGTVFLAHPQPLGLID